MNSKDIAIAALNELKSFGGWLPTIPLMKKTLNGADERARFRSVMNHLRDLGIVERSGVGKFKWKLIRTDYNPDNPLKTLRKYEIKSNKLLAGITGYQDPTNKSRWYMRGETYPHRERLKALGCSWDEVKKEWWIPHLHFNTRVTLTNLGVTGLGVEGPDVKAHPTTTHPTEQKIVERVVEKIPQILLDKIEVLEKKLKDIEAAKPREVHIVHKDKTKVELKERTHPLFETVLFHVNCGDNVMLVGPKGCGKTYLCEQVAKAMKLDYMMLSLSGGVTESKLFGRVTPNITTGKSEYHPGPFAEQFEKGGLFLLDEVDAADPNVLLSINSALANGVLALDRPKNPLARRHKDFVCMAAANTWGSGADRQYVGRNQQDSAFTERFVQLEMDYDRDLERQLCHPAGELVDLLHKYRDRVVENRLERTISTRFMIRAKNWLDHGKDLDYVERMLFAGWRADEIRKVKG